MENLEGLFVFFFYIKRLKHLNTKIRVSLNRLLVKLCKQMRSIGMHFLARTQDLDKKNRMIDKSSRNSRKAFTNSRNPCRHINYKDSVSDL